MKRITLIALLAMFQFCLMAQESMFKKNDKVLNLGIGFGSTLYSGTGYKTTTPPISASFEVGAVDDVIEKGTIGIGGYLGYSSYKWEYKWFGDSWGFKYSDLIIGARGTLHYPLVEKLDTYTGIMLGYEIISYKEFGTFLYDDYNSAASGMTWSWYLGGRYYFNDNIAGMMELGYGVSYLTLGVAAKF